MAMEPLRAPEKKIESVDVLILGAGLSGIGNACQLRRNCPEKKIAILEARTVIGGTWDLFRYPGVRSDSDMYTYSYGFKPWSGRSAIASADAILSYIRGVAREYNLEQYIRYQHKVVAAKWSPETSNWVVDVHRVDTGDYISISCNFILSCCGYYDYERGHIPDFDGLTDFEGTIVHPQHWPSKLDYHEKRVVVVGSGATAITLVPTMAADTSHMVMLQRSPTYIANVPAKDPWSTLLNKWAPKCLTFRLLRWKKIFMQRYVYRLSRINPGGLRRFLVAQVRKELGPDYDVNTHFKPKYNPWDQRLCAALDGDIFQSIRDGNTEVVTDHIEKFDKNGIILKSGGRLDADIVILATGLKLQFAGGVPYSVGKGEIDLSQKYVYRGMMLSNVPNLAFTVGYTNSSWTLKTDLTGKFVCGLLKKMMREGHNTVTPVIKGDVGQKPLLDLTAGYVLRANQSLPKSGTRGPWRNYEDYIKDFIALRWNLRKYDELEFD